MQKHHEVLEINFPKLYKNVMASRAEQIGECIIKFPTDDRRPSQNFGSELIVGKIIPQDVVRLVIAGTTSENLTTDMGSWNRTFRELKNSNDISPRLLAGLTMKRTNNDQFTSDEVEQVVNEFVMEGKRGNSFTVHKEKRGKIREELSLTYRNFSTDVYKAARILDEKLGVKK